MHILYQLIRINILKNKLKNILCCFGPVLFFTIILCVCVCATFLGLHLTVRSTLLCNSYGTTSG